MIDCRNIYEIALPVRELARATDFYVNVLGCSPAYYEARRQWQFLWLGRREGVVLLQRCDAPIEPRHVAFRTDRQQLMAGVRELAALGVAVEGPVFHDWMNAHSAYFDDPDGHSLELIAPAGGDTRVEAA